jgi:hypothetical protein
MPVLGESEKARLQRIFEWSNGGIGILEPSRWRDNEQADNEEVQLMGKRLLGGQGALRKQKRWLDILANEVVERETVLKVMRAERQDHLSKGKLRHEIQERIKRMKEIQNNIARQERLERQSQMAELVDLTKSCHATYNAQREKNNKTNEGNPGGLSSHSKRLLEHNLNTSTDKPAANHRRYKHSHSTPNFPSFLPPKGSNGIKLVGQSKENHHHHHDQENHHHHKENHRHHVDKRQERDLKTFRHHRTSCRSESELKTKSTSRP